MDRHSKIPKSLLRLDHLEFTFHIVTTSENDQTRANLFLTVEEGYRTRNKVLAATNKNVNKIIVVHSVLLEQSD